MTTTIDTAVLLTVEDRIATVTLNRPDRLNAVTGDSLDELVAVLDRVADDPSVSVVVLTGAGRAFCAGGDLAALAGASAQDGASVRVGRLRRRARAAQLLREMPKITIAMINGPCAGAGLSLACAADLRIAASSAKFTTAFVSAGLSGDFGGSWTLPRIVGEAKARELYLLGEPFGANVALAIGLVAQVVDDAELTDTVHRLATRLAERAPRATAGVKANLNQSANSSFTDHLDRETERHIHCQLSADSTEAARAFMDKRKPVFTGQ